jgi:site-specific recombinase XerD
MKETKKNQSVEIMLPSWQGEFAESYSELAKNSRLAIQHDIDVFLAWWKTENENEFSLEKLTSWDLHAFRRQQVEEIQVEPATWNRRLCSLTKLVNFATKSGYVQTDILTGIKRLPETKQAPKSLRKNIFAEFMRQVERNLNTAKFQQRIQIAAQDMAIVALMTYGGLRESEVTKLTKQDIELGERSGWVKVNRGKREKSRKNPLSVEARRLIKPWLERCTTDQLFDMTPRTIQNRIGSIGKQIGENITPHQLRHTFGKRMVDAGVSLEKVQQLMGHSDLRTTGRYIGPVWSDLEDAVEKI